MTPTNALAGETTFPSLTRWIEEFALGVCVVASLVLLFWILLRCRAGFDFTDEGFYLNWISSPRDYQAALVHFAAVYYPLYRLFDGDIVLLRQANVLIIFCTAFALCLVILRTSVSERFDRMPASMWHASASSLVLASGSLVFFHLWLPSPGYNSLNFVSLMMTAAGLALTRRASPRSGWACWILIGVGGALTLLAKPSSAALLAFAVAGYLLLAGRLCLRGLALSVLVTAGLLLTVAMLIEGSPFRFYRAISDGLKLGSLLLPDHGPGFLFRLDDYSFGPYLRHHFELLLGGAIVLACLTCVERAAARWCVALVAIVLALACIGIATGIWNTPISYEPHQPMLFGAIAIGIALSALLSLKRGYKSLSRDGMALALFLVLLPYVYVFGTGNNYVELGARVGFLVVLGVLTVHADLAGKDLVRKTTPLLALALFVPAITLYAATNEPYRQVHALASQSTEVTTYRGAKLLLDHDTAAYVDGLLRIATENGFHPGDYVIDLSGASPGAVYLLGGRSPGMPWLIGGYPGSNAFLQGALDIAGCGTVARSWILTEPGGPTTFDFDLLRRYGIHAERDYREVGAVNGVRALAPNKFEHRLFRPTGNAADAIEACEREKKPLQASPGAD
jgi:hypothetical protein